MYRLCILQYRDFSISSALRISLRKWWGHEWNLSAISCFKITCCQLSQTRSELNFEVVVNSISHIYLLIFDRIYPNLQVDLFAFRGSMMNKIKKLYLEFCLINLMEHQKNA